MNPKTKEFIERHIQKIINEFDFENQKLKNSKSCPCFVDGKCHEVENLNCFLCFCPEYDNSKEEGGCKRGSLKGKWFVKRDKKIWDCSDCDYPHKKETVEKHLKKVFRLD